MCVRKCVCVRVRERVCVCVRLCVCVSSAIPIDCILTVVSSRVHCHNPRASVDLDILHFGVELGVP